MINLIVYVILLNTSVVLASQKKDGSEQLPNDVTALQEMVRNQTTLLRQKDALLKENERKMLQFFDVVIERNELIPEWQKEELKYKMLNIHNATHSELETRPSPSDCYVGDIWYAYFSYEGSPIPYAFVGIHYVKIVYIGKHEIIGIPISHSIKYSKKYIPVQLYSNKQSFLLLDQPVLVPFAFLIKKATNRRTRKTHKLIIKKKYRDEMKIFVRKTWRINDK